jgi:RsmE family RNA methyltransferase
MKSHEFSLYVQELGPIEQGITLVDQQIIHRVMQVLRLQKNERVILFNRQWHANLQISLLTKTQITFSPAQKIANISFRPYITCFIPVLKKEALEHAVYCATELGATQIQLFQSMKTRVWQDRELDRLQKIIIAAAEQSKNFAFPDINKPQPLRDLIPSIGQRNLTIFFDPEGMRVTELLPRLTTASHINLLVGPEGDLVDDEKAILKDNNVFFCSLTPTILRASQAAVLGLGLIRSLAK